MQNLSFSVYVFALFMQFYKHGPVRIYKKRIARKISSEFIFLLLGRAFPLKVKDNEEKSVMRAIRIACTRTQVRGESSNENASS